MLGINGLGISNKCLNYFHPWTNLLAGWYFHSLHHILLGINGLRNIKKMFELFPSLGQSVGWVVFQLITSQLVATLYQRLVKYGCTTIFPPYQDLH